MIGILFALAAAAAAPAPPAPAPSAPAAGLRGAALMKSLGMSDAGIQVLRRQNVPDPDAKALLDKRQALRTQLLAAASAVPFDVARFTALIRESSAMETAARGRSEERIVTTLKALPAADRPIFAKAVFGAPPRPPAEAPAPQ